MTPFEQDCVSWYFGNVTPFTMDTGTVGQLVAAEDMDRETLALFLKALGVIYAAQLVIKNARAEQNA